jgi:hypothetical protein
MVSDTPVYPDHFDQKADGQSRTDQEHKTGGKKGHDKGKRVGKTVCADKQVQAEQKKKEGYQHQQHLADPPCVFHSGKTILDV